MKQKPAGLPKGGARTQVVDHKAKVPFWKPSAINEKLIGMLVRVVQGAEGRKSLRILTATGPISVGINFALADVDWLKHVGKVIEIVFTGEVGSRHGRTYDVFVVESDNPPF